MTQHDEGLVDPEGVNAGSGQVEADARSPEPPADPAKGDPAEGDPRTGGDPAAQGSARTDDTDVEEALGPPDQQDRTPGQELSAGEG